MARVLILGAVLALTIGVLGRESPRLHSQEEAVPEVASTRVLPLEEGWNLVAWTGSDIAVEDAVSSIAEGFETVLRFDASAQGFGRFDASAPAPVNTLASVATGDGLWVRVATDTTWIQARPTESRDTEILAGFNLLSWTGPSGTGIEEALGAIASSVDACSRSTRSASASTASGRVNLHC